jgi:hypothetical protein
MSTNKFVARNGIVALSDSIITGSLSVTNGITGSFSGTATSASYSTTALTASYADTFTVAGTLTAQKLVVQTITSSIVYSSGSNIFGNSLSNTQQFTGSLQVSGSTHYLLGNVLIGTTTDNGAKLQVNGRQDSFGSIRSTSDATAISGSGAEMAFSAGTGFFFAYNRSTSAYLPVGINGTTVTISTGAAGTPALTIASTGAATFANYIFANGAESNTINPVTTGQISIAGGYSAIRSAVDHSFNIDVYNSASPINALKISQTGALNLSGGQITLTGATSAFMQIVATNTYAYTQYTSGTNTMYLLQNQNGTTTNGTTAGAAYFYMANAQDFQFNWEGTTKATITSTGAASFSSSINAGTSITAGTSLNASTTVVGPQGFRSVSTSQVIPFTTWTTFYNIPGAIGLYMFAIGLDNVTMTDWNSFGIIRSSGVDAAFFSQHNGSLVQTRISGMALQVYQNGGSPSQTLQIKIFRIQ